MLVLVITVGMVIEAIYGQSTIGGGRDARVSQHPYQVSLQTSSGVHVCSGFLISKTMVVTPAHCVYCLDNSTIKTVTARVGSNSYNKGGQTVQVETAIVHPDYDQVKQDSDIAILKLASTVTFKNARAARLPPYDAYTPVDTDLSVTGWGKTDGNRSEQSQVVRLRKITHEICQEKYGETKTITFKMYCARSDKAYFSGDFGGPQAKGNTVWGMFAGGSDDCADYSEYPGIYTRIAAFTKWIKQNAGI